LGLGASGGNGLIEVFQTWTQETNATLTYYLRGMGSISASSQGFVGISAAVSDAVTFQPLSHTSLFAQPTNNGLTTFEQTSFIMATLNLEAGKSYQIHFSARSWDGLVGSRDLSHTGAVSLQGDFVLSPSSITPVSEPSSIALLGFGAAGMAAGVFRRRRDGVL
jgi:hypothetical protein